MAVHFLYIPGVLHPGAQGRHNNHLSGLLVPLLAQARGQLPGVNGQDDPRPDQGVQLVPRHFQIWRRRGRHGRVQSLAVPARVRPPDALHDHRIREADGSPEELSQENSSSVESAL